MHQKLKQYRVRRGLTMKDLAERVGTSQQQIDRLEKGRRRLTLEWIDKLSNALDCSVVDLLPASHQPRDEKTAKAKVLGEIRTRGKISWFGEDEIYSLTFGRARNISNARTFALVVNNNDNPLYQAGSELIFSEVDSSNTQAINRAKLVICERGSGDDIKHSVDYFPVRNVSKTIKAVLVKSIRDE